jgi:subtilisin family serine protease
MQHVGTSRAHGRVITPTSGQTMKTKTIKTTTLASTLSILSLLAPLSLGACAELGDATDAEFAALDEDPESEAAAEDSAHAEFRAIVASERGVGAHEARALPPLPEQVENRYIVRLRDDVEEPLRDADELTRRHGGVRRHVYASTIKGFTVANLTPAGLKALRDDPNVVSVTEDKKVPAAAYVQSNPDWSLDRIDQESGLNMSFSGHHQGSGVHVYVVDSGVRSHQEFGSRLSTGVNTYDSHDPTWDESGHGTAVASAAAGNTRGVARSATIHPVKITDRDWAWASDLIAGVDWVTQHASYPAVINLSYDGSLDSIADALSRAIQKGITVVKAAGNEHESACTDEGNVASGVIAVGATDSSDQRSSFSDYGPCISIFAPGVSMSLAWWVTANSYATVSGTSFSAPLVAGVAAAMLGQDKYLRPHQVKGYLQTSAFAGKVQDWSANSPNLLLNAWHQAVSATGVSDIVSGYPGVETATTYTWTAKTLGGNGSWTYKWERSINGGAYGQVGTGKTLSLSVAPGTDAHWSLRISATSVGRTVVAYRPVDIVTDDLCTNPKLCGGI